jgi:hypothetical protein
MRQTNKKEEGTWKTLVAHAVAMNEPGRTASIKGRNAYRADFVQHAEKPSQSGSL